MIYPKKYRKLIVKVISLCLCASFAMANLGFSAKAYYNISTWAQKECYEAAQLGLVPESIAYADFGAKITREEFCQISILLYQKLSGKNPPANVKQNFKDTNTLEINQAFELGIVSGQAPGIFAPNASITRQEMSKMFYNLLVSTNRSVPISDDEIKKIIESFSDFKSVAPWAYTSMGTMIKYGITNGVTVPQAGIQLAASNNITRQEATMMGLRFYKKFLTFSSIDAKITSPKTNTSLAHDNIKISWNPAEIATSYNLYVYEQGAQTPCYSVSTSEVSTILPAEAIAKACQYDIQVVYYDQKANLLGKTEKITVAIGAVETPSFTNYESINGIITIPTITAKWKTPSYSNKVYLELWNDDKLISEEVFTEEKEYTFSNLTYGSEYTIRLYGTDMFGNKNSSSEQASFLVSAPTLNVNEKMVRIFGKAGTYYKTEEEAKPNMTQVEVNAWAIDKNGSKVTVKRYIDIHKNVAEDVVKIFGEIYNGDEKFPIKDVGGYNWRGNTSTSQHNYGLAIDINYNENAYMSNEGVVWTGKYWKPGEDIYSVLPNGDVVKAFAKYGWGWGGLWNTKKDYMHFSYFGI